MNIGNVMTGNVRSIHAEASIREAAMLMKRHEVGSLIVNDDDRLIGMVTDRDIALRATALGSDPNRTPVWNVLSRDIVCCYVDEDIRHVAEEMRSRKVRRMPVVDRGEQLVGLVSVDDIARALGDADLLAEVLENSTHGWGSRMLYSLRDRARHFIHDGFGPAETRSIRVNARPMGVEDASWSRRSYGFGSASSGPPSASDQRRWPKGYKRPDQRIFEDVCDRLAELDGVDVSDVSVKVQEGRITLEGTTPDRRFKRVIEQVAEGVTGVSDVINQLRTRSIDEEKKTSHSQIAAQANASTLNPSAPNLSDARITSHDVARRQA